MHIARITSIAIAMSTGFSLSAAHASATPATFEEPVIVLASADAETPKEVSFDFRGFLHSFMQVDEANTTKVATAEPHAADECPAEKEKSKAPETKDAKKADKKAPQGPEPIYFAF